ncbi:putative nb-arc and tpr domain protein [Botrytis fragariae]|uniref:Putative nb-arc and tpr domain protein n=1 Tax=Botrytis fragariae TaxID=1964551 RepID=A0A8H6AP95_9HELO|nr:putative nb-arc and tpr domain protein [Botrytis fragariae]KAF5871433.1 putative nb-arc and tpr domain protein [Botrytis fragariae]
MSGVEFIAVLGIASNVIAVVDACTKIQNRIQSYRQNTAFRDLSLQLPLLISAIESLRSSQYRGLLDSPTEKALVRVLEGCLRQLQTLEGLIKDLTPSDTASKFQKTWKGIRSFGKDTKVREIVGILAEYKSTIALHLSTVHTQITTKPEASLPNKKSYFDVPQSRVSNFVGRKDVLNRIQTALEASHNDPSIVVLTGVGGQGKTQIALQYSHQHMKFYKGVFWIDASSRKSASRGFERILKTIDSSAVLVGGEEIISVVKNILGDWKEPWLLVFDNYDDPKSFGDLPFYFPNAACRENAIIVTSRHISSGRLGSHLKLDGLTEEESVQLLTSRCTSVSKSEDDLNQGRDIVKKLGYLPLAIDQAAGYISIRHLPLHMFSDHFQRRKEFILKDTPQSLWEYQKRSLGDSQQTSEHLSVLTTWELSFDQISGNDEERNRIGEFLAQAAYFSPMSISESLFKNTDIYNDKSPGWKPLFSTQGSWDSFKFQDVIVGLVNLSIIQNMEITSDEVRFSFHPLVKDWLQLRESVERRRACVSLAIALTASVIQETDIELLSLHKRQELLSHIDACIENKLSFLTDEQSIIEYGGVIEGFQTTFATFYGQHDRNNDAERLFMHSLDMQISLLGTNNVATLSTMNNLAAMYLDLRRLEEARPLLHQALEIKHTMLGPHHPRTLNTANNLANLLVLQLHFDAATEIYERTLIGYQNLNGPVHKTVIESLNNLGEVAMKRGNFLEAEKLFKEGLKKLEIPGSGGEDGLALYLKANIALVYKLQHRHQEAEQYYHTIIQKRKALLGPKHSSTLQSMCELGDVYFALGQLKLAGEWYIHGCASKGRVIAGTTSYRNPKEEVDNLRLRFELLTTLNDQGIPDKSLDTEVACIDRRGPSILDDSIERSEPNMPNDPGIHVPQGNTSYHPGLGIPKPDRTQFFAPLDRGGIPIMQQAPSNNAFSASIKPSVHTQELKWNEMNTPSNCSSLSTPDDVVNIASFNSIPALESTDHLGSKVDRTGRASRNKQLATERLSSVFSILGAHPSPIRKTTPDRDQRGRQHQCRAWPEEKCLLNVSQFNAEHNCAVLTILPSITSAQTDCLRNIGLNCRLRG